MRNQDIIEYLQDYCICDPNNLIDEPRRSTCGFTCKAKWHWSEEIYRMKLIHSLPKKFVPPEITGKSI